MEFVNGNLPREAARIIGWRGSFWRERYHLIPISPEPEALIERLRYVLSNTVGHGGGLPQRELSTEPPVCPDRRRIRSARGRRRIARRRELGRPAWLTS